jgi:hypothetical protein
MTAPLDRGMKAYGPEVPRRQQHAGAERTARVGLLSGFVVAKSEQKRSWRWKMWRSSAVVNDTDAAARVCARKNR